MFFFFSLFKGIQNFPEGLAVSLPLHASGFSLGRSFWYGQLSGMVEPIFGVLGECEFLIGNGVKISIEIFLIFSLNLNIQWHVFIPSFLINRRTRSLGCNDNSTDWSFFCGGSNDIHCCRWYSAWGSFKWKWHAGDVGMHYWFHCHDVPWRWIRINCTVIETTRWKLITCYQLCTMYLQYYLTLRFDVILNYMKILRTFSLAQHLKIPDNDNYDNDD